MKLSEAIRCGAQLRDQGFGNYFMPDSETNQIYSCALGAAIECVTGRPIMRMVDRDELFPDGEKFVDTGNHKLVPLFDAIVYRNDTLKWTREAIADWVEQKGY